MYFFLKKNFNFSFLILFGFIYLISRKYDSENPIATGTVVTFRILTDAAADIANARVGRDAASLFLGDDDSLNGNTLRMAAICAPGQLGGVGTGCRVSCLTNWRAVDNSMEVIQLFQQFFYHFP